MLRTQHVDGNFKITLLHINGTGIGEKM